MRPLTHRFRHHRLAGLCLGAGLVAAAAPVAAAAAPPAPAGAVAPRSGPDLTPRAETAPPRTTARAAQAPGLSEAAVRGSLTATMRGAGRASGAYVRDVSDRRTIFSSRASVRRILASNTKLYTASATLRSFGPTAHLRTSVLRAGALEPGGVLQGSLYLRGGGDPTFGTDAYVRGAYGQGATVEALAAQVAASGVREVRGSVVGDESRFDSRRGGPASGYRVSGYVGPLSGLAFNRGLSAGRFTANPALLAAGRLDAALEARGVRVGPAPRVGRTPAGSEAIAGVASPSFTRLNQITNKRSDNFFAEMLLKNLGARASGTGSTLAGARATAAAGAQLGAPASIADGSGLSRANAATPRSVARLVERMRVRREGPALLDSLPVAGRDGTLSTRMRGTWAQDRCRAKTGTLSNVSALSGLCRTRGGDTVVFSILMNGVSPSGARRLQDRMVAAVARHVD